MLPGCLGQLGNILIDAVHDLYSGSLFNELLKLRDIHFWLDLVQRILTMTITEDADLAFKVGITHADLDHKAVHLGATIRT